MKQIWMGAMAATLLSACGGDGTNPFTDSVDVDPDGSSTIPEAVQNDVGSFSYDANTQTLVVSGLSLDSDALSGTYTRNPALDLPGYEAYSTQESPLDRVVTAYVQNINGTSAVVAVTGGQFEQYFGGAVYGNSDTFTPPNITQTSGLATYSGNYVGLTNISELGTQPGVPPLFDPGTPLAVRGQVLINADFADNVVNGGVAERVLIVPGGTDRDVADIALEATEIAADGSFSGQVTQNTQGRGEYGGVFGGIGATQVAGGLFAENHMPQPGINNEEEYGIFVLQQCTGASTDPLCD